MTCNFVLLCSYRHFRVPPNTRDTNKQERIQQRPTKAVRALEHTIYTEKLREIGLFSQKKAGVGKGEGRGELLAFLNYLEVSYREDKGRIFLKMHS